MRDQYRGYRVIWLQAALLILTASLAPSAPAHNLPYTLVEIERTNPQRIEIALYAHVSAYVLGLPQAHLNAQARASIERLPDDELAKKIEIAREALERSFYIAIDGDELESATYRFPSPTDIREDALTSQTRASLSQPIHIQVETRRTGGLVIAGPPDLGQIVIVAIVDGSRQPPILLGPAQLSPTIALASQSGMGQTISRFLAQGIVHIVPLGLDHILFLVSLTLVSVRLWPLFLQVSGFTLAHTLTLGLTIANIIPSAPTIIEPLIAFSIVLMAVLNIVQPRSTRFRGGLIIGLGLLHGLGFAGALRALGLPTGDEVAALIAFNIGVEIGQMLVLTVALLITVRMMNKPWFYHRVTAPASIFIALVGSTWILERTGVI